MMARLALGLPDDDSDTPAAGDAEVGPPGPGGPGWRVKFDPGRFVGLSGAWEEARETGAAK
jgi:hypothetical protein